MTYRAPTANGTNSATRILACCGRGSGKSSSTAVVAAHAALYFPNSLTIVGAPALNVSQELGRLIFRAIKMIEPSVKSENLSRIELQSGSRVLCLASTENARGLHGCETLIIDEATLLPPEMYSVLEPFQSTAKNPRLILLGTPRGKIGKFYEYFTSGNFKTFKVRSDQCSRISPAFLAAALANLGPDEYASEMNAEFRDPTDQMFDTDLINDCCAPIEQWEL
jgi:hypothetical protein